MNYAWKSQAEDLPSNLPKIGSTLSDWVAIIQSMHNVDKKKIQFVNLQAIFACYVFESLVKEEGSQRRAVCFFFRLRHKKHINNLCFFLKIIVF